MSNALIPMQDIPGYAGRYSVTRDGRVWSYPNVSRSKGRWLKSATNWVGYVYVCLCVGGKPMNKYVHRLVAMAWIKNNGKPFVNHKNGKKTDNRACNLEWVTASENKIHAFSIGLTKMAPSQRAASRRNIIKHNHTKRLLSMKQAKSIRAQFSQGKTRSVLAAKYGVDYHLVKRIIANNSYMEIK